MFSQKEKVFIAAEIEKILLSLDHPEMPKSKPDFFITIRGKEVFSRAEIQPNWKFDENNKPGVNPWNEKAREYMKETK